MGAKGFAGRDMSEVRGCSMRPLSHNTWRYSHELRWWRWLRGWWPDITLLALGMAIIHVSVPFVYIRRFVARS